MVYEKGGKYKRGAIRPEKGLGGQMKNGSFPFQTGRSRGAFEKAKIFKQILEKVSGL